MISPPKPTSRLPLDDEGESHQRHQHIEAQDGERDRALDEAIIGLRMLLEAMRMRSGRPVFGHDFPSTRKSICEGF